MSFVRRVPNAPFVFLIVLGCLSWTGCQKKSCSDLSVTACAQESHCGVMRSYKADDTGSYETVECVAK